MAETDDDFVREWTIKAENDLKNIANNLKNADDDELPTDTLCFHAQQAAEKYLKAYLAHIGKEYPFTHNLAGLVKICMQSDASFESLITPSESLTPYSVAVRYPDDFYMPTLEEAKEAYEIALKIKEFVSPRLSKPSK